VVLKKRFEGKYDIGEKSSIFRELNGWSSANNEQISCRAGANNKHGVKSV